MSFYWFSSGYHQILKCKKTFSKNLVTKKCSDDGTSNCGPVVHIQLSWGWRFWQFLHSQQLSFCLWQMVPHSLVSFCQNYLLFPILALNYHPTPSQFKIFGYFFYNLHFLKRKGKKRRKTEIRQEKISGRINKMAVIMADNWPFWRLQRRCISKLTILWDGPHCYNRKNGWWITVSFIFFFFSFWYSFSTAVFSVSWIIKHNRCF